MAAEQPVGECARGQEDRGQHEPCDELIRPERLDVFAATDAVRNKTREEDQHLATVREGPLVVKGLDNRRRGGNLRRIRDIASSRPAAPTGPFDMGTIRDILLLL